MEKLVFVFRRREGATREAFHAHYVKHHSPLGLRVQPGLTGYTVNHLLSDAAFDTVTEIWTPSAAAFAGGGAITEATREVAADHVSFMGPQDSYVVREHVVRNGPETPVGSAPGVRRKLIAFHPRGVVPPPVLADAERVVDNLVERAVYLADRPVGPETAHGRGVALIRMIWLAPETSPGRVGPEAVEVREYHYRNAVAPTGGPEA